VLNEARYALSLRVLPRPVAWFCLRARRAAWRAGDQFTVVSVTRPRDLSILLKLARGRRNVVELGTGTAWTAIALALADEARQVTTYDPFDRAERERYLRLAGAGARARIDFVHADGASGPRTDNAVEMLYIDSSHSREATIEELRAWSPVLAPRAVVVFDDYANPDYPGVREAVQQLGLTGEQRGTLFVHKLGPELSRPGRGTS
jgi:predicted O-methyltransferase YrrM